jgi:hypothetical protein
MLMTSSSLSAVELKLPEFDQTLMDRRFIAEVHRLFEIGAFATFREFTDALGVLPALLSSIESGKYHCNQKLLYNMLRQYPQADILWVLLGSATNGRPEPVRTLQRQRGRPTAKGLPATQKPA